MFVHFWHASLWKFVVSPGIGIGHYEGVEQGWMEWICNDEASRV